MDPAENTDSGRTVVAVFDSADEAEAGLDTLRSLGAQPDDVSVMMRDKRAAEELADDAGVNVAGGAATGAISGGLLGGVAGWLVGIGALAIPGIGPVLGAGALAGLLTGAAIGAAAGGLLGALVGLGVPEDEAHTYQSYVREGRVLITTAAADEATARRMRDGLESAGAYDVRIYGTPAQIPLAAIGDDEIVYTESGANDFDPNAAVEVSNVVEDIDEPAVKGPPPERAPIGGEAIGGAGGAVIGGLIGAAIGGPAGAAIGAAVGGGAGAGAAHIAQEPTTAPVGSEIGGASGAAVGAVIGAAGGPLGAVIGATLGGALGGASGEALQDAGEYVQESRSVPQRDATPPADANAPGPAQPSDAELTIPTDYRSGGEAARSATPEQLASASRGIEPADNEPQPTRGAFTPNTTETEYRSGGDASRGEQQ